MTSNWTKEWPATLGNLFWVWYDDTDRPLPDKVMRAAQRYLQKFGVEAALCLVHEAPKEAAEGIEVKASKNVMPDYFWMKKPREDSDGGSRQDIRD